MIYIFILIFILLLFGVSFFFGIFNFILRLLAALFLFGRKTDKQASKKAEYTQPTQKKKSLFNKQEAEDADFEEIK